MRVDRRNRVRFTLIALVLIALGVLGLLARYDVLQLRQPGSLANDLLTQLPRGALLAILLVLGLLALVVGVSLITGQVGRRGVRIGRLTLQDQPAGTTTFRPDAIGRIAARDVREVPGVRTASASLVAAGASPKLVMHVGNDAAEPVPRLIDGIEQVLARVARVLDVADLRADVHLRPGPTSDAREVR